MPQFEPFDTDSLRTLCLFFVAITRDFVFNITASADKQLIDLIHDFRKLPEINTIRNNRKVTQRGVYNLLLTPASRPRKS